MGTFEELTDNLFSKTELTAFALANEYEKSARIMHVNYPEIANGTALFESARLIASPYRLYSSEHDIPVDTEPGSDEDIDWLRLFLRKNVLQQFYDETIFCISIDPGNQSRQKVITEACCIVKNDLESSVLRNELTLPVAEELSALVDHLAELCWLDQDKHFYQAG